MSATAFLLLAALILMAASISLGVECGVENELNRKCRHRLDAWVYVLGIAALAAALLAGVSLQWL